MTSAADLAIITTVLQHVDPPAREHNTNPCCDPLPLRAPGTVRTALVIHKVIQAEQCAVWYGMVWLNAPDAVARGGAKGMRVYSQHAIYLYTPLCTCFGLMCTIDIAGTITVFMRCAS